MMSVATSMTGVVSGIVIVGAFEAVHARDAPIR